MGLIFTQCKNPSTDAPAANVPVHNNDASEVEYFHEAFQALTDVIVLDIFSPPVASRVYAYPCIAAYEVLATHSGELKSLAGQLTDFNPYQSEIKTEEFNPRLAALVAFFETAKHFVFSQEKLDAELEKIKTEFQKSEGENKTATSFKVGMAYAQHIIKWSQKDNYAETRSGSSYSYSQEQGQWKPTPPAFMEGIEPNWRNMRTFVIGDLKKYTPDGPTVFSLDKSSQFYKEVLETKEAVDQATEEHKVIASFWDCNPYVMNVTGHAMFASKKITPGGHWMGITSLAAQKSQFSLSKSIEVQTLTAIAIYDAFISCWDEKYRSNLVRPETVINEEIDQDWQPLLQTPPFPEHTSGHSVISTAAAEVLTSYFGDDYAYVDDVEVKYGLPSRAFSSFRAAAAEAAISRLYGGIHYRPAIEDGVVQGRKIGQQILESIVTNDNE